MTDIVLYWDVRSETGGLGYFHLRVVRTFRGINNNRTDIVRTSSWEPTPLLRPP